MCGREKPLRQQLPHAFIRDSNTPNDRQTIHRRQPLAAAAFLEGINLNARGWIDGKGNLLPDGTDVSQTDTFTTASRAMQDFSATAQLLFGRGGVQNRTVPAGGEQNKNPAGRRGSGLFPAAQHRGGRDAARTYCYFLLATASLSALPGRNFGTLASAMLISLPVWGFLPVRA